MRWLCWCCLLVLLASPFEGWTGVEVQVFHPIDFSFTTEREHDNPFKVSFDSKITGPNGQSFALPGFYDGKGAWKVRFSGTAPGEWSLTTQSDDPDLDGQTASFSCTENKDPHVHGGLKVDPEHPHHFVYEDGTRYFLMGYECDWLWALDQGEKQTPTLESFLDKLADHGFNHIILNGYAHDTSWMKGKTGEHDYGPPPLFAWEGTNEKPDHGKMNLEYWKHYDRVIQAMFERGIVAHIMIKVYNKKVKWPKRMGEEDDLYFRWIVSRYAAYPNVVWDFSKESYNEKDPDYKKNRLRFIHDIDPYDRLVTLHDDKEYDSGKYDELADFHSDQNHKDWHKKILSQRKRRHWPVVNVEFGYEHGPGGMEDKTYRVVQSGEENVRRAWEICMAGGYPAYYYTYTAWDVIRPEDTPTGYGLFAKLRTFFEGVEYWNLEPSDELIEGGYALANPGEEYIFYFPEGKGSAIDLSGAKTSIHGEWFHIYTGERKEAGLVGAKKQEVTPPTEWVGAPVALHLIRKPKLAFPGERWEKKTPKELGLDGEKLDQLAKDLGGHGCVIKDGYLVHEWGDTSKRGDWLSSAKPVLSTLLFFAIEEGLVESVDQTIANFGWDLKEKDRAITFRHLGAMTSGYARPDAPGEAFAYNDFAIQLYQQTLFDKVFQQDPKDAAEDPNRLGALGLENGLKWREKNRRLSASAKDFARIAWFWLNKGNWNGEQVLPGKYFEEYMTPQVPKDLPHTQKAETDDYLDIGSFGGGSDHFTEFGPGIYGFNWWFNGTGREHPDTLTWPDAPEDAIMSIGAGGNCSIIIPSENLVVVCAKGEWGKLKAGVKNTRLNKHFQLIREAISND